MNRWIPLAAIITLLIVSLGTACTATDTITASALDSVPQSIPFPQVSDAPIVAAQTFTTTPYLDQVDIALDDVKYLPLLEKTLPLNDDERSLLTQNGFVVSDRIRWDRFIESYAWIYWKDLPVLVTTDSLLHAFHQSYVDLLKDLEMTTLKPQLGAMLEETRVTLADERQTNVVPDLDTLYADVDAYLAVALHLLEETESTDQRVQEYVEYATAANAHATVTLFTTLDSPPKIDFTLFEPRAHYAGVPELQGYFRAMSWLGQVDFRFVAYDSLTNEPVLDQHAIAAATILRNAIDKTDQRLRWSMVNSVLELLIGRSDNTTLPDLDRFLVDAGVTEPGQLLTADATAILDLLLTNDYGQQRITGQLIVRDFGNTGDEPIPRPTSFLLLGQRFALDSFVLSELVFDRLMPEGAPKRALPSPLDAISALGNPRARTHLQSELSTYQYTPQLETLSQTIAELPAEFWQTPIYNQWLGLIRTLNESSTGDSYPQAMRTAAWADKILQTQLGSWTQLRHDNILYVKQSFTTEEVPCEYPAGYVEPYPDFYAALGQLAHDVQQALESIPNSVEDGGWTRHKIMTYLKNLETVSGQLKTLAEKELRAEPFTKQEEYFLKSMIKLDAYYDGGGCGSPTHEEVWDGWYANLFYQRDDNPALIADVHTNPTKDPSSTLYPPRVLHAATGPAAAEFLIVDTDEGPAIYIGPAFTYFEIITEGDEDTLPDRLNDEEWRAKLATESYPDAPSWTQSFRLPPQTTPRAKKLPQTVTVDNTRQSIFLPLVR